MVEKKTRGSIVCTTSVASVIAGTVVPHGYTASKHALVGLIRSAAGDLGKHGIRVNGVAPFGVATPLVCEGYKIKMEASELEEVFSETANLKGIVLKARHVAEAALFLASDDSAYATASLAMASSDLRRPPKRLRTPMLSEEQVDVHLLQERNKRRCFTSETPLNWRQHKRDQVSNLSRACEPKQKANSNKRKKRGPLDSVEPPFANPRHTTFKTKHGDDMPGNISGPTKVDTDGDDCEEAPTIGTTSTGVDTNKPPGTATSKVAKKARIAYAKIIKFFYALFFV
ncbi:hypothetical protein DY000_02057654 [Brassica cretica]|uniref:3-oxoacyl-[acyl-carrier-protein] reductase n=1 Tax=Brassica cretica TaxID=69181 RepID=A0ABQ7A7H6_BRACR|nr:hypothetical protein DY000_02057654 [Brassica cretica]